MKREEGSGNADKNKNNGMLLYTSDKVNNRAHLFFLHFFFNYKNYIRLPPPRHSFLKRKGIAA